MSALTEKRQTKTTAHKLAKPGSQLATRHKRLAPKAFVPDIVVMGQGQTIEVGMKPPSPDLFQYTQKKGGVEAYLSKVRQATPMEIMELERQGVHGALIKDLSKSMALSSTRFFSILGVPKATAEKKAAAGERVTGRGGQSAIGMLRLLDIAQDLVDNSTAAGAKGFDAAKWLGKWIETPQPALDGRKPADFVDTPTGVSIVARVLGSIHSGAYQ